MKNRLLQKYSKHSFALFFVILTLLAVYVMLSFVTAIIAAAIIAYVFHPEFKKLNRHIKSKSWCAFIMIVIILLIVIIPLLLMLNALAVEAVGFYQSIKGFNMTPLSDALSRFLGENIDASVYVKEWEERLFLS